MARLSRLVMQSVRAVKAFRMRTFFCLVSVALGIASIVIIVAATEGAFKKADEIVARFGPDSLLIFSGGEEARAVGLRQKTLTLEDIEAVRQSFPSAYLVVPMTSIGNMNVSYRERKHQTQVIGSTNDYSRVWTWPVIQGSDFSEEDVKGLRNVGLIGQYLLKQLFEEEDPVGKYIFVKGIPIQVVGVLGDRGTSPSGQNLDDRIIMPLTTVMRKIQNETKYVSTFRIRFYEQKNLYKYVEEIRSFLRQ
ncbi:MAG: ABC transporter permease, partial [Nitrospirae bacterium]|nr:ABC transporter permease [Nitrospirota bacterium]